MDLHLTPEAEKFRDDLRSWLADNLERSYTEEVLDPSNDEDSLVEVRRRFQKKLNDAGYLGMAWPEQWGGRGATQIEEALLKAELAAADAPQSPNALGLGLCAPALIHHGTEEQRKRFLPAMLSCDEIWCQGFSEPGAGSDLAGIRAKAEPDGEDFRISGQKVWTTLGPWSDWIFVLARTDMEDRHGGISFFLMPIDQPGVEMRALKQISGESEFGEVFFDNALARREHLVGKIGEGWRIAMTVLGFERGGSTLLPSSEYQRQIGCLVAALRESGEIERADVREKVGSLIVENEVLRANGLRSLAGVAQGLPPGAESSIDKIFWSEFHQRLTDTAVELMGPQGQLELRSPGARSDVHWMYEFLWARAGTIYSGSSEIQRNIIAKRVLKMPTR